MSSLSLKENLLEFIIEALFIYWGCFLRWLVSGRKIGFVKFSSQKADYWKDLLIGVIFWITIAIIVYWVKDILKL